MNRANITKFRMQPTIATIVMNTAKKSKIVEFDWSTGNSVELTAILKVVFVIFKIFEKN